MICIFSPLLPKCSVCALYFKKYRENWNQEGTFFVFSKMRKMENAAKFEEKKFNLFFFLCANFWIKCWNKMFCLNHVKSFSMFEKKNQHFQLWIIQQFKVFSEKTINLFCNSLRWMKIFPKRYSNFKTDKKSRNMLIKNLLEILSIE